MIVVSWAWPRAARFVVLAAAVVTSLSGAGTAWAGVDLSKATIVSRPHIAAEVLRDELAMRIGVTLPIAATWPNAAPVIVVSVGDPGVSRTAPARQGDAMKPEGFLLKVDPSSTQPVVWVLGADDRGALFGVGELLRHLRWAPAGTAAALDGEGHLPDDLHIASAPAYTIRGHQLGYRAHSNSYDAFDEARYDRYIRELALFGVNAIENIPFQDTRVSPHFRVPRDEMNVAISRICARYGLDYWMWTPADYDLDDAALRAETLDRLEGLFRSLPRLDAIFVPGGDPGHNHATLVLPYLADLAERLQRHHPRAKVWLSLQWFPKEQVDWIYSQINDTPREWLGGLVAGPSSPPLAETRRRLHSRYRLRDYPDITHVVRSQYEVPDWDPAFNYTHGREPINPRPVFYAQLHDRIAPYTDGFISYSDGVNDDVNKVIWSRKAWSPSLTPREVLVEYARLFFGEPVAERAADGLLALEKNWQGPLATNGAVDATLAFWQQLDRDTTAAGRQSPLRAQWRWQQALFRAYYDAYTRHRLLREAAIEARANAAMLEGAASRALAILAEADTPGPHEDWREEIESLGRALFDTIGMQLDTPRYGASGRERGAVLDFLHTPLNNRVWLEDELAKVAALRDDAARRARLAELARWEQPGPGSYYDDIGHVGKSPHVRRVASASGLDGLDDDNTPHFTWENEGRSRRRLSWLVSLRWPSSIVYDRIDPTARYVVRLNGNGDARLRINGEPVTARVYGTTLGAFKEYDVPASAVQSRQITLTFDEIDESDRNWRQHSRLHEVWLLKQ